MKPAVHYVRVSTQRQGKSGLGMEAQQSALARFCRAEGFECAAEFVEVETGKGQDALDRRPKLAAALDTARKLKCPVIVAKLDRLSRARRGQGARRQAWQPESRNRIRRQRGQCAGFRRANAAARCALRQPFAAAHCQHFE